MMQHSPAKCAESSCDVFLNSQHFSASIVHAINVLVVKARRFMARMLDMVANPGARKTMAASVLFLRWQLDLGVRCTTST